MNQPSADVFIQELQGVLQKQFGSYFLSVGGSYGGSDPDQYSDLDLLLVVAEENQNITPEKLKEIFKTEKVIATHFGGKNLLGWSVYTEHQALKIDLGLFFKPGLRSIFDDILVRHEFNISKHRLLALYNHQKIIHDSLDMGYFSEACREYPEGLRRQIIKNCLLSIRHPETFAKHLLREDYLSFSSYITTFYMRLILIFYALNRLHTGRTKRAAEGLKDAPLLPSSFINRMNAVLRSPDKKGLDDSIQMMNETIQLIRQNVPETFADEAVRRLYGDARAQ